MRELAKFNFIKNDTRLAEKKIKLYKNKDITKWELRDPDLARIKDLLEDEKKAYDAMLP